MYPYYWLESTRCSLNAITGTDEQILNKYINNHLCLNCDAVIKIRFNKNYRDQIVLYLFVRTSYWSKPSFFIIVIIVIIIIIISKKDVFIRFSLENLYNKQNSQSCFRRFRFRSLIPPSVENIRNN